MIPKEKKSNPTALLKLENTTDGFGEVVADSVSQRENFREAKLCSVILERTTLL